MCLSDLWKHQVRKTVLKGKLRSRNLKPIRKYRLRGVSVISIGIPCFAFFYQKACVSTTLNSKAWPRGYSDEDKIELKPRESEFIRHNRGTHRMLYLGHGPADEVRLHKKLTSERVKRGLPPTFLSCVSPELNSKPKKISVTQLPVDFVPESPSFFSQDSPIVATASNLQDETAAVIVEAPISAREENAVVPRLLFQEKAIVSADKKVTKANLICF